MPDMSIVSNIRDVERDLSDFARKQLPFATSLAINATLDDIHKNETRRLERTIDRPTPFTRKAYGRKRANKFTLAGAVFAKDIQAGYLKRLEKPSTRLPKGRAIVIPRKVRLNKYGNMPKGRVKKALASPKVFSGRPRGGGAPGIYQRMGRKGRGRLVRLIDYAKRAVYRKAPLQFERNARLTAEAQIPIHFERALNRALRTARP